MPRCQPQPIITRGPSQRPPRNGCPGLVDYSTTAPTTTTAATGRRTSRSACDTASRSSVAGRRRVVGGPLGLSRSLALRAPVSTSLGRARSRRRWSAAPGRRGRRRSRRGRPSDDGGAVHLRQRVPVCSSADIVHAPGCLVSNPRHRRRRTCPVPSQRGLPIRCWRGSSSSPMEHVVRHRQVTRHRGRPTDAWLIDDGVLLVTAGAPACTG
jgi:hypothetical protein